MNNLMELVSEGERFTKINEKADKALDKSRDLFDLGFRDLANSLKEKAEAQMRLNELVKYNYICLTKKKIQKFLDNKAAAYNKGSQRMGQLRDQTMSAFQQYAAHLSTILTSPNVNEVGSPIYYGGAWDGSIAPQMGDEIMAASTCDAMTTKPGTIGRFVWTETRLENYKTLPPDNILTTLKEHKARNVFHYFTIASVNEINDPLLLGRVHGCDDRYYLAQWGTDIALDEVI